MKITLDSAGQVRVFIDDILVSEITSPARTSRSNDWLFALGNFDGYIDELRISNTLRSSGPSIAALKAAPVPAISGRPSQSDSHGFVKASEDTSDQILSYAVGDFANDQPRGRSTLRVDTIYRASTQFIEVSYVRLSGGIERSTCQYSQDDLFYSIETSSDLAEVGNWQTNPSLWQQLDAPENHADGTETVRIITQANASKSLYIRLRVQAALND